ncbi:ABC transporter transmembrane domain-containing protein [Rhizobium puerariae]|uniref:ABC transporter transmembrane domain-containing protein n=1 Tax=Rhizobium puerariae TaxID=1585791 RepID=A0ABV6AIZ9_9HYPH
MTLAIAIAQAASVAASAETITRALQSDGQTLILLVWLIVILAFLAGVSTLGERWSGELLAQSYITAIRSQLFEATIHSARGTPESRWLTSFVSDLTALRNWATNGPVRMLTSTVALAISSAWFVISSPQLAATLLPIGLAMVAIGILHRTLGEAIVMQRRARGRLTRFVLRRIRIEVGDNNPGGHGRKTFAERSGQLASCAVARARITGLMDAIAMSSGLLASLILVTLSAQGQPFDTTALAGALTLLGFLSSRIVEFSRALQAFAAGHVALHRIRQLLEGGSHPNVDAGD